MSNHDSEFLKAFLYHISHDLKAPIRHIREFHRLLIESLEIPLTSEQKEFEAFTQQAITKLSAQLEGLLTLSRANSRELEYENVDLFEIVNERIKLFNDDTTVITIENTGEKSLSLFTDLSLLYTAINELISNAIKFRDESRQHTISIKFQEDSDHLSIRFMDNGVGIPDETSIDPFLPFQRFSNARDIPGVGVGLSTVKFIASRLGGQIAWKSNVDYGVTFILTLPKSLTDH